MTGKPTPGPMVDETALLFAEALTASRKLTKAGYDGLEAVKALPEVIDILRRLETAEGYCSLSEIQSEAFYFLDRLTKKDETDDAA